MRITARQAINWFPLIQRIAVWSLVLALLLFALWPMLPWGRSRTRMLVLYGFSILGEVMNEGVFPAFQAEWQRRHGERVEFISSFASSGTITNQLILGVPAQVAILSLELDALRLVDGGVLSGPTWRALPHRGVVNRTPFIIMVRPGNPRGVRGFADLANAGVGVVHPDPLTSGGAQWAILAEYGAALRGTGDRDAARRQLLGIWRNVVAQASSARAARTQFENGFGDALITYEQEALRDRARGRLKADVVYPRRTILSEHTAVIVEKNIRAADRELVRGFVAFLWSERAQRIFVEYGFRSADDRRNAGDHGFGTIADPFLVSDLGGWTRARAEIIDAIWMRTVLPEVGR